MGIEVLFGSLGVSSYTGALATLQPTLAGEQALEASRILTTGDQTAARSLLDRMVREDSPEQFLRRLRGVTGERRTLFDSPAAKEGEARMVLRGGLSFAELAMELAVSLERKDSEAGVILLENSGVVSRGVCRILRQELSGSEVGGDSAAVLKKAHVFVTHLARLLADPNVHEFPDITHHPSPLDVQILLHSVELRGWVATEIFGRITLLNAGEFKTFLLGEVTGIFHPSIKIFSDVKMAPAPQSFVTMVPVPIALGLPVSFVPQIEGALILAPQLSAKLQDPSIPYKLLRRAVYRALSAERFEEAARMVENISDEFVLARLFDDLRMKVGDEANHLPHTALFFANTAIYAGKMFDQMNPETVVSLLLVMNRHVRWHDQKALDQWLLLAFRAIRSRSEEEESGSSRRLPRLSVILGTLMEWEETRELAQRWLREGLNPSHEAYGEIYSALEALHERSGAFLHPLAIEADSAGEIYDEAKAAAELDVAARSRIVRGLAEMMGQKAPIAPHFDPPRRSLAGREAVFEKLRRLLESPAGARQSSEVLSTLVLFALRPAEVWRLAQTATEGKETGPAQFLAGLLAVQSSEVVLAFFSAWGRGLAEDEDVAPLGSALAALWRSQGDVGPRLVTDVVDAALNDDAAVAILQKALSQHGTDTALIWDQAEIYVGLAERLGEKINSYEIFVTTGVLRPGDLEGRYRGEAIEQALEVLKDLDAFGKMNVPGKEEVWPHREWYEGMRNVPAPELAPSLSEEDQIRWRHTALETLVKLTADERAVVDYLLSQLDGPHGRLYYDALDRMGPRAQAELVARIRKISEEPIFEKPAFPDSLVFKTARRAIADLIQRFPLSSPAMQRYLRMRLANEGAAYKKEYDKSGDIESFVTGKTPTPGIIIELAELGDEAVALLRKITQEWPSEPSASNLREVATFLWHGSGPAARVSIAGIHLLELIGTPAAHAFLAEISKAHPDTRILLYALARIESEPGYDGPSAVADYLNGEAGFMEKLEIPDYLGENNPFLNKLLGRITDPAFYLFVIRALKDKDKVMRYAFLNWHTHSDDVVRGAFENESTRTLPTIVGIAKDESAENFQREIAIHTLFWYYRRVHSCGPRTIIGMLDLPLMRLLKQIEPALKELCASGATRYADPEDVHYVRAGLGEYWRPET